MVVLKPDITYREVDDPPNRWCDSGHVAPERFARGGDQDLLLPTRFFHLTGKLGDEEVDKTLCEPCCVLINYLVRLKKKEIKESNGS